MHLTPKPKARTQARTTSFDWTDIRADFGITRSATSVASVLFCRQSDNWGALFFYELADIGCVQQQYMESPRMIAHNFTTPQIVDVLQESGSMARQITLERGNVVHQPEESAESFFLIETGQIRLFQVRESSKPRLLEILGADDWLGAPVLAGRPSYGLLAEATSRSIVWAVPAKQMYEFMERHSDLALHLMRRLALRLISAWEISSALASDDCRHRLIQTLLRFSESSAAQRAAEGIELRITHSQLAQAVGAARETVSVCLTELRNLNIVRTGRNRLAFDPEQLRNLSLIPATLAQ
jgi:CRP/FNR family transcriptional regulator, cyclic AMP receptor protein